MSFVPVPHEKCIPELMFVLIPLAAIAVNAFFAIHESALSISGPRFLFHAKEV